MQRYHIEIIYKLINLQRWNKKFRKKKEKKTIQKTPHEVMDRSRQSS